MHVVGITPIARIRAIFGRWALRIKTRVTGQARSMPANTEDREITDEA
jgi:hypothetical protein